MSDTAQDQQTREESPRFITQTFAVVDEDEYFEARGGVPIRCQFCIGQRFRRSRLRSADIRSLFLMRYPVRCLRCAQRQLVSFTVAGISLASQVRTQRRRRTLQQSGDPKRPLNNPGTPPG